MAWESRRSVRWVHLPGCRVDLVTREVHRPGGAGVRLTLQEARLLERLAATPDEAVSRQELLVAVWGYHPDSRSRAPDVAVRRLRTKLEVDPSEPVHVATVLGHGWVLRGATPEGPRARPPATDLVGRDALIEAVEAALLEGLGAAGEGAAAGPARRSFGAPAGAATEPSPVGPTGTGVCLVGPPGVGKTELARHVAQGLPMEVVPVPLEGARDEGALLAAVAAALRLPVGGITSLGDHIGAVLRGRDVLLWLDGAEGVVDPLERWLAAWPGRFLVTSRVAVGGPDDGAAGGWSARDGSASGFGGSLAASESDGAGSARGSDGSGSARGTDGSGSARGSDGSGSSRGSDGSGSARGSDGSGSAWGTDGSGAVRGSDGSGTARDGSGASRRSVADESGSARRSVADAAVFGRLTTIEVPPLSPAEAEALFRRLAPEVEGIGRVVEGLDGLPLGIRLAAARVRQVGLDALVGERGVRYERVTSRGASAGLEDCIARSWALLDPVERDVMTSLVPLLDTFDLAAAEAVTRTGDRWVGDVLVDLVRASLLVREPNHRYRMLESVRWFASRQGEPPVDRLIDWALAGGGTWPTLRHLVDLAQTQRPDRVTELVLAVDDVLRDRLPPHERRTLLERGLPGSGGSGLEGRHAPSPGPSGHPTGSGTSAPGRGRPTGSGTSAPGRGRPTGPGSSAPDLGHATGPGSSGHPTSPGSSGPDLGHPTGPGSSAPDLGQPTGPGSSGPDLGHPTGPGSSAPGLGHPTSPGSSGPGLEVGNRPSPASSGLEVRHRLAVIGWRLGEHGALERLEAIRVEAAGSLLADRVLVDLAGARRAARVPSADDVADLRAALARTAGPGLRIDLLWELAEQHTDRREFRDARLALQQAIAIDRDGERRAELLCALGHVALKQDRPDDGLGAVEEAVRRVPVGVVGERGWRTLGGLRYLSGDLEGAATAWEHARDLARDLGLWRQHAVSLGNLGAVYADLGDTREARRVVEEALARSEELGQVQSTVPNLVNLGKIALLEGDPAEARELLGRAVAIGRQHGWTHHVVEGRLALAIADQLEGGDASDALREVLAEARAIGADREATLAEAHLALHEGARGGGPRAAGDAAGTGAGAQAVPGADERLLAAARRALALGTRSPGPP